MGIEAILLAIANGLRPTGLATVYALLASRNAPRLLAAFVVCGLAWSISVGVLVVVVAQGVHVDVDASTAEAIVELLLGGIAIGFAAGRMTGKVGGLARDRLPGDGRLATALRDPTPRVAALAGVATHLPGVFYLLGLDVIAAADPGAAGGIVDVVIFNAIWFSIPIASLVLSVRQPERTREALGRVTEWARRHERLLVSGAAFVAGVYFAASGMTELLD